MPRLIRYDDAPFRGSIIEYNQDEDELFLTYNPDRINGPKISRTGMSPPYMQCVHARRPGETTTHPDGQRVGSWLIQESLRETDRAYIIKKIKQLMYLYMFGWNEISGKDIKTFKEFLNQKFNIYHEYVFSWEDVPGGETELLKKFLNDRYNIDQNKGGISKSKDKLVITNETYSLTLNKEKSEVILKISDGRTDKFIAKPEKDKNLKIYTDIKVEEIAPSKTIKVYSDDKIFFFIFYNDTSKKAFLVDAFGHILDEFENQDLTNPELFKNYLKNEMYVFSWEDVPGGESELLEKFLKYRYNINQNKDGISKSKDELVITNKTYSLTLNKEKSEVILNISDGRTDKFIAKPENGKRKIYIHWIDDAKVKIEVIEPSAP